MKKKYLSIGIAGFIILVAVLTNPDQNKHREAVMDELKLYIMKSQREMLDDINDEWEIAGANLGIILGEAILESTINKLIRAENYVLFSRTKSINLNGETTYIGIGAFGNVYISVKTFDFLGQEQFDIDNKRNKTDFENTASALFEAYRSNQVSAELLYNGKMIAVVGTLSDLIQNETSTIAYFKLDEGMFGDEGVRISMLKGQESVLIEKIGQQVTIKGRVGGYNQTDVVLHDGKIAP